jgi:hypothetical protein
MSMTEDEQRIALCEWMGWTISKEGEFWSPLEPVTNIRHGFWSTIERAKEHYPNTNSLDVLHGFEMKLTREQQEEYANHVYPLLPMDENHGPGGDGLDIMVASQFQMLHATAAQRREALLRTLNLWQEPKP